MQTYFSPSPNPKTFLQPAEKKSARVFIEFKASFFLKLCSTLSNMQEKYA